MDYILRQDYGFLIACPMLDTIRLEMDAFLKETYWPDAGYMIASPVV